MTIPKNFSFIFLTAILYFVFFLPLSTFSCGTPDPIDKKIDEMICVHRLSERAILITMGADAVTAVQTQKGIVVIDAGISYSLTMKYRKVIEKTFGRRDFVYVIHTHAHPDHVGGDPAFPEATIVGHENGVKERTEYLKDPEKVRARFLRIAEMEDKKLAALEVGSDEWNRIFSVQARYQYAYNDMTDKKPEPRQVMTFKDSVSLPMGDETFHLKYFGKAHSESDILIHVPGSGILLVGDLFFPGGIASIKTYNESDMHRWMTTMSWAMAHGNEIKTVIGGHGDIMSKDDLELFNDHIAEKWTERYRVKN